jgi:hypothetical protein
MSDEDLIRKSRQLAMAERAAFRKLIRDRERLDAITNEIDATLTKLGRFSVAKPTLIADLALGGSIIPFGRKPRRRQP